MRRLPGLQAHLDERKCTLFLQPCVAQNSNRDKAAIQDEHEGEYISGIVKNMNILAADVSADLLAVSAMSSHRKKSAKSAGTTITPSHPQL